jgi:HD superfamily phosphohydrolase
MKTISDPVYGTIQLTDLEVEVVDTPAFQRLRRVSQLGLTGLVFPSAGFSRFTHSLGVCHLTGLMLDNLQRNNPAFSLSEEKRQLFRLAGLLHDLGHYPYSHITEHAAREAYTRKFVLKQHGAEDSAESPSHYLTHEQISLEVAKRDPQLKGVLSRGGVRPHDIWAIIWGEDKFRDRSLVPVRNLISADMDADRMDYMLRTNHHSGIPYGYVDLEYLLTQLRYDSEERIVTLSSKALAAADHMLVNRYFNYQQIAFNKTVAGLELALEHLLFHMLGTDTLDLTPTALLGAIEDGTWCNYDEHWIRRQMESVRDDVGADDIARDLARAVLDRSPLKLLQEHIEFKQIGPESERDYAARLSQLEKSLDTAAKRSGVGTGRLLIWGRQIRLTKVTSSVQVTQLDDEDLRASVRLDVIQIEEDGVPAPIVSHPRSLMKVLSQFAWEAMRVYLVPKAKWKANSIKSKAAAAAKAIAEEVPTAGF